MLFRDDKVARLQHNAVRENVGWYKWTHNLLEVKGSDATKFLDSLYVNSIAKTQVLRSKYTTMLNEEGLIIDDVIVMHMNDDLFWVSTLYLPELIEWIEAKKGDSRIEYRDITDEYEMYAVQGPNSREFMNKLIEEKVDDIKYFSIRKSKTKDIDVIIHRSGFTGELGFEIYCAKKDNYRIENILEHVSKEFDAVKLSILEVIVRSLPVEKGYVLRQDILGLNPYEIDMGWTVDMDKEFIGKAALEKLIKNGHKHKLVGLEFESYNDINQGEVIKINGVQTGVVVAAIYGYTIEKNIGYGVVEAKVVPIGSTVQIGMNNVNAKVVEKIWYDPENKRPKA